MTLEGARQLGRWWVVLFCFAISPLVQALELRDVPRSDLQKLRQEMPLLFSGPPTQALLDDAIRFLMKTGSYEFVSFERKANGEYVIAGRPLRTIEAIEFVGQDAFSRSKLLEVIELQPGDKFDLKKATAAGDKLKTFYGESGYFNSVISLSFPKAADQNVILHFEIQENLPCRILGIDLKTDNPVLKRRLLGMLHGYIDEPLTDKLLQSLIKKATNYFIDHRYLTAELLGPEIRYNDDKSAAYIAFEVKEPYRWEFFFDGNVFDSQLDVFRAMNWDNRDRKNVEPASEGAERIRRDYIGKGFAQAQVEFQVDTDEGQYLKKVFYEIREGFRVRLKSLEIQGRISRAPSYYSNFITSNSSDLIERGYYNRQDLEDGFKNLITELRNQGYLKARIQSSRIEYGATKRNATVYVLIDEGPMTLVQTVDFEGNHFFSSFELTEVLGLQPNSPCISPNWKPALNGSSLSI